MDHNELVNSLTLAAVEKMDLRQNLRTMQQKDYEKYVLDSVINTYLEISHVVINGERSK